MRLERVRGLLPVFNRFSSVRKAKKREPAHSLRVSEMNLYRFFMNFIFKIFRLIFVVLCVIIIR